MSRNRKKKGVANIYYKPTSVQSTIRSDPHPQPSFLAEVYICTRRLRFTTHTYLYGARYDQEGAGRGRSRALHSAVCDVP